MNFNNEQANKFLQWLNDNYAQQKTKLQKFCNNKNYSWSEDVFCDTYVKVFDKISKNGIADDNPEGYENYLFQSFTNNIKRELQYARNSKRADNNNLPTYNEVFKSGQLTEHEKLLSDLWKDYSVLYILKKIENVFPYDDCRLFKIKLFEKLTYKELLQKTGVKGCRQKIINIKNWIKENVRKEDIRKEFETEFQDLMI